MKRFLLSILLACTFYGAQAQESSVSQLPTGRYETVIRNSQNKWERGDIILIDDSHYKVSVSNEVGEYKFSTAAQRIFFTSGPLKNVYARTSISNNTPAIILPVAENAQAGIRGEVWGLLRQ